MDPLKTQLTLNWIQGGGGERSIGREKRVERSVCRWWCWGSTRGQGAEGGVACAQATRACSEAVQSAESGEEPRERKPCSPVDPRSLGHQAPAGPRGCRAEHQPLRALDGSAEQSGGTRSRAASGSTSAAGSLESGSPKLRGGAGQVGAGARNLAVNRRRGGSQVRDVLSSLGKTPLEVGLARNFT